MDSLSLVEGRVPGFLARYLAFVGLLVNVVFGAFLLYWLVGKASNSETYRDVRRHWLGAADGVELTPVTPVPSGLVNSHLKSLPKGVWLKIHQQSASGPDYFRRQAHGGAAFDPVRGRLMLFGSDTHRSDWDNTVRFFDMGGMRWSAAYAPDDPQTYRVNGDGIPVAGKGVERPWAMHTFDAVEFDPVSDRLIVASHPGHLDPKKPWGLEPGLWRQIKSHPTWSFVVGQNRWEPLVAEGTSFFPYGVTFDPHRRSLIGVKSNGYWSFDVDSGQWQRIGRGAPKAWHNAAAFDTDRDVVVSFGTNERSSEVWQYRLGDENGRVMPTPGVRPPGASSAPLVYHPAIKKVVALVETKGKGSLLLTETWLYSTSEDAWERLETARIPFAIGMNYNMVYDPNHGLLVLVANVPKEPLAVWVLRL